MRNRLLLAVLVLLAVSSFAHAQTVPQNASSQVATFRATGSLEPLSTV
jgi:hypothetical protein